MSCSERLLARAASVGRIGNAQEFELMKISVGGADIDDSVLFHDGDDVKIVEPGARHARVFARQIADHLRVPVGLHQDLERSKRAQCFDEMPSLRERERTGKGQALRGYAEKLVTNTPDTEKCQRSFQ
jgi:hypothetical protein